MANRFPYIQTTKIDNSKIVDLFSKASNMDTFEIKNYSLINKIPLSVQDNNGNNLIHHTILDNGSNSELIRLEFIRFLYNENVNPDAPNRDNITPLLYACSKQYTTIVNYLIKIGVDINYVDNFGNNSYHYLFGSIIKNYNPIVQKSLFPRYKEVDESKLDFIKNLKKKLFETVLQQGESPELESIINTIKLSIGNSNEAKKIVIEFQNRLNELIIDNKSLITFNENQLFTTMLNKFISLINKNWKSFPKSGNIILHSEIPNSYPIGDSSGLSIIRDNDYKVYIKKECDRLNDNLINNILKNNNIIKLIDLDEVNNKLLTKFVNEEIKDDFRIKELNTDDKKEKYNNRNRFIHSNCIDNADNIIDYKNNTFAGGSRQVEIEDEFEYSLIETLFSNSKEKIVGVLAYSLIYNYNTGSPKAFDFTDTFNIGIGSGNTLLDNIVEYIYSIAMNENIIETEEKVIEIINTDQNYIYLLELIEKREKFNPGHYLYVFCCAYKGIDRIINETDKINLTIKLRQGVVLLCSAVYRNSGDILKSLYNVFKPLLIDDIINKTTNINDIYSNFIKLLLTDGNIIENSISTNVNLDRITVLTNEYFEGKDFELNDNDRKYLGINEETSQSMNTSEKLGFYIVKYYNDMPHKPLLQNIVDILVLIRLFEIRGKQGDKSLDEDHFINRLKSLYLKPIDFDDIGDIKINANMEHTELIDTNIDKYFITLFNTNELKKIYEQISQYQIPSRINYFLYGDYKYLNGIIDNERRLFLLKQIEANHFGLNFIGLIPSLKIIRKDIGSAKYRADINLFYYNYTQNRSNPVNYTFFHTDPKNDYLNRPPTYLAYFNLLQKFTNNINELQNRILSKLRDMFTQLKSGNTNLYSKAIAYYYPILNALESYEKFFNDIANDTNSLITDDNLPIDTQDLNPYFKNTFNIQDFNNDVNRLNALLFLYYYLDNTRSNDIIKIPKFLYHQLGDKPIVFYDNPNKNINYPPGKTLQTGTPNIESDTTKYEKQMGNYYSYNSGNDYNNIIKNIQNRRFFISRDIIDSDFIISKKSKLPPSLKSVFNDFLKLTINSLARKAIDSNIDIEDKYIDIIPNLGNVKDIQKKLLKAIYTQELIIDYLKNNVYTIGYELFTELISETKIEIDKTVENIFGNLNFNVLLDKEPSLEEIRNITKKEKDIIKNYYNFSDRNMEKIIQTIKNQFKLYPNNYNSIRINKAFYKIEIKKDIVSLLLDNNCNLFTSNNENQLSIINLLKHHKCDILEYLNKNIDFNTFNTNNSMSPQRFILNEHNMNLRKFVSSNNYYKQLSNFTSNQYSDVLNSIMGDQKLGFNIINNLQNSFVICNYITQQFLSEKMYDFNDSFKYNDLDNILKLINKNMIDFKNVYLNKILGELNIPRKNNDIVINDIIRKLNNEFDELVTKFSSLENIKKDIKLSTINNSFKTSTILNMGDNINEIRQKIKNNREYINKLIITKNSNIFNMIEIDTTSNNVIDRYKKLLDKLENERLVMMEGFRKMFIEKDYLKGSNENIIQQLLNSEKTKLIDNIKYNKNYLIISKFYSHLSEYCEVYFHNEYICNNGETINPIKEFVKELLIFLTQNVICVGIETLVRKVLFEYFSISEYSSINLNKDKVNLILERTNFKDNNYNILAEKLVMNNTNLFQDEFEENQHFNESVNDLINSLLDDMINSSPIPLNEMVKEKLKNITSYFETIVPKTINNWRVVIENMFLFVINHGRILKCMNIVGLPEIDKPN